MRAVDRSNHGYIRGETAASLHELESDLRVNADAIEAKNRLLRQIREGTHVWGDAYVERSNLQAQRRIVLEIIAALLMIDLANEFIDRHPRRWTEHGRLLHEFLESEEAFGDAVILVEKRLPERYDAPWLPAVHRVLLRARSIVSDIFETEY